ncbi:MAG: VWA domain-containing protein [Thermoanaerobaculia bacterium]|nr:VWA domain-containing protein [Thermoanaerobaculia bacterium]
MTVLRRCLACALLAAATAVSGQQEIAGTLSEQLDVTLIDVEIFARDRAGLPVTDLRAEELKVFDNDQPVELTAFSRLDDGDAGLPFSTLVVFVDDRHLSEAGRSEVLSWLGPLLLRRMDEDGMRGMVVGFGSDLAVYQSRTRRPERVETALARAASAELPPSRIASLEAAALDSFQRISEQLDDVRKVARGVPAMDSASAELDSIADEIRRDTVLVADAVQTVLEAMALADERTALVVVSSGFAVRPLDTLTRRLNRRSAGIQAGDEELTRAPTSDQVRGLDAMATVDQFDQNSTSRVRSRTGMMSASLADHSTLPLLEQLVAAANSNRVTILPVIAGAGGRARSGEVSDRRAALALLAQGTGGSLIASAEELDAALSPEASAPAAYRLGYQVGDLEPDSLHRVRVRCRRRGVRLEHRQSYIARSVGDRLAATTASALFLGAAENPLGLTVDAVRAIRTEVEGRSELRVTVSWPIRGVELIDDGRAHHGRLRLVAWMYTADERLHGPQRLALPLRIPGSDLAAARDQSYGATLAFVVPGGPHRIAVGLWDETARRASWVRRYITVD